MIQYVIYQTTNLVNGKIYVGQHKRKVGSKDYYIGSGSLIKRAIQKYGRKNFKCEILHEFDTREKANEMEAFIVNESFIARPDVYNLNVGGAGPGGKGKTLSKAHINAIKNSKIGVPRSEETKRKMSITRKLRKIPSPNKGKIFSPAHCAALSKAKQKPIKIDDTIYPSAKEIAEKYNVTTTTVRDRIKSTKWLGWKYYDCS